jgi:hypothetical protein
MRLTQSFHNHGSLSQAKRMSYCMLIPFMIVLIVGCSKKSSTKPTELSACNCDLAVCAGSGTTPTFYWTPACKLAFLIVEKNGGDMWGVMSDSNSIAPGVVYGVVPAGVTEIVEPQALLVGITYRVAVRLRIGPGDDIKDFSSAYVRTFTP